MVTISRAFPTLDEALDFMRGVMTCNHPAGYQTSLTLTWRPGSGGRWTVTGSRASSAD